MFSERYRNYTRYRLARRSVLCENGCREWIGVKNKSGYGLIGILLQSQDTERGIKGKRLMTSAHRAAYMMKHNVLLSYDKKVCHTCDNPSCIELSHLFLGTAKDNIEDCSKKGRRAKKYKLHTRHKTFPEHVILAVKYSTERYRDVAIRYGMSQSYVSKLRRNVAKTLIK